MPTSLETIKKATFSGCSHPDLCIDLPETLKNIGPNALSGCRVRLPTSLSILSYGGDVEGLLQGVEEVVMSNRVNLSLLVRHIDGLPNRRFGHLFLYPDLKFKVLYSDSSAAAAPLIGEHVPEFFFSFDVFLDDLIAIHRGGGGGLVPKVKAALMSQVSVYADLSTHAGLPEELFSKILPFIYGEQGFTDEMLGAIVLAVKKVLVKKQSGALPPPPATAEVKDLAERLSLSS